MTSHGWFDVASFADGVTMIAEPGHYEDVKSFLIEGDHTVIVFDTGMGVADFAGLVRSLSNRRPLVVQSHAHFDHIGASAEFDEVLVHEREADDLREGYPSERFRLWFAPEYMGDIPLPAGFDPESASIPGVEPSGSLSHGDRIDIGGRVIEVYHTPGHSPGGISLYDPVAKALFPGDAIYLGPMFAFRETSDPVAYRESLRLLAELAEISSVVYPSHNEVPIAPEKVIEIHRAYEEIWSGRSPDERSPEKDTFRFDSFRFDLAPGRYGG